MFDGILPKRQVTPEIERRTEPAAANRTPCVFTPEEHARRVRDCREALAKTPGFRGRLIRIALDNGWC